MVESAGKVPVQKANPEGTASQEWQPFESLRREVDQLFEDFARGSLLSPFRRTIFDVEPFWSSKSRWSAAPAVDIVEKSNAYEITAELPGLDEKNIEVKLANGGIAIRGEKQHEQEEKKKDYYLHERRFGSFERRFAIPEGVDPERIEASFKKGVLTVKLPKHPVVEKPEKKINVKAEA